MNDIERLVALSRYAGERFDLTQAGGGNSSVKLENGEMLIKTSGYALSEIDRTCGYSSVNNKMVVDILYNEKILGCKDKKERDAKVSQLVHASTGKGFGRASIETLLHSLLAKYTLHTHPVVVNAVVCRKDWRSVLSSLFENIALLAYRTPGFELAIELKEQFENHMKRFNEKPKLFFLQNHGLIVTSDSHQEVIDITESVLERLEEYLNVRMERYKLTTKISSLINRITGNRVVSYLSEDKLLYAVMKINKNLLLTPPFCPDQLVYCGVSALELDDLDNSALIKHYISEFHDIPKVIIVKNYILFVANTIKKARDMEDVFKFHIQAQFYGGMKGIAYLDDEELAYLSNWEAEQHRQNI